MNEKFIYHDEPLPTPIKKARRGSIKRAVQDLVPVVQACALLAVAAHDGKIPLNEVLKLVRAAYRGEEKARCAG